MKKNPIFGELLTHAIHTVRLCENSRIQDVEREIGSELGRTGRAIERWRQGPLPPSIEDKEKLAETIFKRCCDQLDFDWFLKFLKHAGHPDFENATRKLFGQYKSTTEPIKNDSKSPTVFQAPPLLEKFIGRRKLVDELVNYLSEKGTVCILHGMAGVGKSSLAVKIAYEMQNQFPDGVIWADLENMINEHGLLNEDRLLSIQNSIAQAYQLSLNTELDLVGRGQAIKDLLAPKRILLIFDNVYWFKALEPFLLPSNANCSIIATSRNARIFEGHKSKAVFIEEFTEKEGLELFEKVLGRKLSEEELRIASSIHNFLGGLPLAIQIIANGMKNNPGMTLSDYQIALQSERHRLDELKDWSGASKNIRATFELSLNQIDTRSRLVFLSMGLLAPGGLTIEALETINGISSFEAKKALGRLLSLALVQNFESQINQPNNMALRFYLHPLLRTFARYKLELFTPIEEVESESIIFNDEQQNIVERATGYFSEIVLKNPEDYRKIDMDWPHIKSALEWLRSKKEWIQLSELLHQLTKIKLGVMGYMDAYGRWDLAIEYLEKLLDIPHGDNNVLLQAQTLLKLGGFHFRKANFAQAEKYLHESKLMLDSISQSNLINLLKAYSLAFMAELKMSSEPSEAVELAKKSVHCLKEITAEELHFHEKGYLEIRQATAMARSGMLSEARDLLDKALEKLPQSPSNAKVSGLMTKGIVEDMLGNFLISKAAWKEGLALAEVLGDGRRQAGLLRNLAIVAEKTGVIPEAIINNRKALSIYQQIGDDAGRGHTAANLSVIFLLLQQYDDAFPYIETALGVAKTKKLPDLEAYSLVAQARWQLSKNHLEDAHITLVRALQLSQEIELLDLYSEIYRLMAVIAGSQKDFVEANRLIALALENASDDSHDMGNCYRVRANIFSSQEYSDEANMAYETSQTIFKQKSPFYRARTELDWAKHLFKNREYKQSSSLLKHALKIFNETDATVLAAEVTQMFNLMTRQKAMGKGK